MSPMPRASRLRRDVLEQIGADLAPLARDVAPLEEGLGRTHGRDSTRGRLGHVVRANPSNTVAIVEAR